MAVREWMRDARFGGLRKNLARNPSMETLSSAGPTTVFTRRNIVPNPSAEVDLTGWGPYSSGVVTRDTTEKHDGAASFKVAVGTSGFQGMATSVYWPAIPGEVYVASAWVKAPLGQGMTFNFRVGTLAAQDNFFNFVGTGDWQRVSEVASSHPTAGTVGGIQVRTTSSGAVNFWVDSIMVEAGTVLQPFFDGSTVSTVPGVTNAWDGPAGLSASTQTSRLATVRTNLATDPEMTKFVVPNGGAGATDVTGWGTGGAGTYSLQAGANDSTYPVPGLTSMLRKTWSAVPTDSVNTGFNVTNLGVNALPVASNTTYTFSIYMRQSAGTRTGYAWRARWLDAAGALLSTSNGTPMEISSSYGPSMRPSLVATSPVGAAFVELYVGSDTAAFTSGTYLDVMGLLIEQATFVGQFFSGNIRPAIRVNRAYNPAINTGTATGWNSYYSPVVTAPVGPDAHRGAGCLKVVLSAGDLAAARPSGVNLGGSIVAPGDTLHMKMWLKRTPQGPAKINVSFNYDAGTGGFQNTSVDLTEQWVQYEARYTVPAGTPLRNCRPQFIMATTDVTVAGEGFFIDDMLWEINSDGDYFDGNSAPNDVRRATAWGLGVYPETGLPYMYDPDYVVGWLGANGGSQSVLGGYQVADFTQQAPRKSISSKRWVGRGARSLRILTHSTTNNDSFQAISNHGLVAGKSYIVTATLHLDAVQVSPSAQARTFLVGAVPAVTNAVLLPVPNQVGTWRLVQRIDIAAGATINFVRLMNGGYMNPAAPDDDSVWWDELVIEPFDPALPWPSQIYFDGSFRNAKWDGTADLSTTSAFGFVGMT